MYLLHDVTVFFSFILKKTLVRENVDSGVVKRYDSHFCRIVFYNADAVFISIYAVLINADAAKMPAYGTTVPYEGHNCALSVALLYRKGSKCFF